MSRNVTPPVIDLREILEISDAVFSAVGLCLNSILLYLILNKTSQRLKEYRKLLLQNCIIDIVYNLAHLATRAELEFKDGNLFVIITDAWGRVPVPYNCILSCIWVFALLFCITSLPVQFVFRYFLIVKNTRLTMKQYTGMLLTSFLLALSYTVYATFCLWPTEPSYSSKAKLFESDKYYYKGIPNYVTSDIREWPLFGIYIYCYILMVVSYSIVVWTSFKVWKYLKSMQGHLASTVNDVNSQITKTLVMQAITPLLICLFPIIVTVTMVFLRASIGGVGLVLSIFYSWVPIGNSLVTLIVVKSYRQFILHPFKRFARSNMITSMAPSGNSNTARF